MNIVFMGTPDFAGESLKKLIKSKHNVVGVFSQPDKPVGRKQILTPPNVKVIAEENNIKVYQPEKIKGSNTLEIIKSLNPDIIVVVAYGKILPPEILKAARYGCVNVHASLLPKYRGAAPIQWAVLNGDSETGITIMQMDEGLDTGDLMYQIKTPIDRNETSAELFDRLAELGADSLLKLLDNIDTVTPKKQPQGDFGYASMINKSMSPIDWSMNAVDIHNHIRGLQTWPCATTALDGKNLKIHKSIVSNKICENTKSGTVVDNNKCLTVCCGDKKCIDILEVQLDGKKKTDIKSFLQGHNIDIGTILG